MTVGVEIWTIDLAAAAAPLLALEADLALLTAEDRASVANVVDQGLANRRLATVIGLRVLLCNRVGADAARRPFVRTGQGKPQLPGAACHFNVAHSGDVALVALSTHPVGVDLEMPRTVQMDARRRRLIELAAVAIADWVPLPEPADEQRFLQAWTRLEALGKADGCGIGRVLTEIGAVGGRLDVADEREVAPLLRALAAKHVTRDLELEGAAIGACSSWRTSAPDHRVRRFPVDPALLAGLLAGGGRIGEP